MLLGRGPVLLCRCRGNQGVCGAGRLLVMVVSSWTGRFVSELLTVERRRWVAAAVWFVMCGRCNR